jgi:nicotinate-nucleotide adenylyltransferase
MRIGVLGGTFDPIHKGHLALAEASIEGLKLNQILLIPMNQHPFKNQDQIIASPETRLEMVRLAVEGNPMCHVSDLEIKRGGVSFTVDTLEELKKKFPDPHTLFFITGGDWGCELQSWKNINRILSLACFVVANRPGYHVSQLPEKVSRLEFEPLNVSSTEIRCKIKKGESISADVPPRLEQFIKVNGLYLNES